MLLKVSHYRILQKLGSGGKAEVYLAEDLNLRRKVALKLMHRHLAADAVQLQRFRNEAEWASMLNHPNIVTVHEVGESDGFPYIASEFVEGTTLRQRLETGPIALQQGIEIAMGIASALIAAHEIWIVHRDIKPENIMIRPDGYVKVLDFGAAKIAQPSSPQLTQPGKVVGTLRYLAPEQVNRVAVDPRTDLFALGEVIYEMIAGKPPFTADNLVDLMREITETNPPHLSTFNPEVPDELESLVERVLRKEMDQRHQSAKELLADLRDIRDELVYRERSRRPFRS